MKIRMRYLLILLFGFGLLSAQDAKEAQNHDSIPIIQLQEIQLVPNYDQASAEARTSYKKLVREVYRAYPFAKKSADYLSKLNKDIAEMKTKKDKKKYIKRMEVYVRDEFTPKLKNLTVHEGKILIRLIQRQTGITVYELMKELKSTIKAFSYNIFANMFSMSLKDTYKPQTDYEDFLIEAILTRAFFEYSLEPQPPALEIDYAKLSEEWVSKPKTPIKH